jgi:hypothetical protein
MRMPFTSRLLLQSVFFLMSGDTMQYRTAPWKDEVFEMEEELHEFMMDVFCHTDLNQLPGQFGHDRIFSTPLLGAAAGDDPMTDAPLHRKRAVR